MTATGDVRGQPPGRTAAPSAQALVVGPALALVAGAAVGAVAGTAVGLLSLASASADDDWASLGALIVGGLAGVGVSGAAYVAALVAAARRLFPPGRRAAPVLLALVGQAAVAAYGALLLALLYPTSWGWALLLLLLAVTAAACGPAAFVWVGAEGPPRRTVLAVVLGSALAAGLVVVGSDLVAGARTDRVADGMPLVLFDGETADPAYPGWRRDPFETMEMRPASSFTDRGHEGYLKYFVPGGVVFVTMHAVAGDCAEPAVEYTCAAVGRTPVGELRSYVRVAPYGSYPRESRYLALVYPDGSAVSVNVEHEPGDAPVTVEQAMHLLTTLQRVDRGLFEDRTGSRLDAA